MTNLVVRLLGIEKNAAIERNWCTRDAFWTASSLMLIVERRHLSGMDSNDQQVSSEPVDA
jgi:hypothetical protein